MLASVCRRQPHNIFMMKHEHVHIIFFKQRDYQRWRLTMILVTRLIQVKEFNLGLNADELVEKKAIYL